MTVAPTNRSTSSPRDLESRVDDRKRQLISEIVEHKKNSSRACAAEAIDRATSQLRELAHIMKEDVADGWAKVGPSAKLRLDEWMAK
jgi:hypothetical protein